MIDVNWLKINWIFAYGIACFYKRRQCTCRERKRSQLLFLFWTILDIQWLDLFPCMQSSGHGISKVGYHFQRDISQGHPMTVSCKLSVQGSKFWLEFSIAWGQLKICTWLLPLRYNFQSLSNKFPKIFWSLISHILLRAMLGWCS